MGGGGRRWTPAQEPSVLFWLEPRSASNTTVGGKRRWADLSGHGKHANAPSAGANPPEAVASTLNGVVTGQLRTTHSMVVSAVTRPRGIYMIAAPLRGATAGYVATSYGAGFSPAFRNNGQSGWGWFVDNNDNQVGVLNLPDDYLRPVALVDGGLGANACKLVQWDTDWKTIVVSQTFTANGARQADGLDFTINDLRFPTNEDIAVCIGFSTPPSDTLLAKLNAYFLPMLEHSLPPGEWVGTLADVSDAHPRLYWPKHNGVSGLSLADFGEMVRGVWTGTNVTLGSAGDPGPGLRGATEELCVIDGWRKVVPCLLGVPAVETQNNDATFDAFFPVYERDIRRMWAISQGAIERFVQMPIMPGLRAPFDSTRGARFNAWVVSTLIPNLAASGIPMTYCDLNIATFNPAIHCLPSDQHFSELGGVFCGSKFASDYHALGLNMPQYHPWWIGHSHTVGAHDKVPRATSQIRAPAARALAQLAGF